MSGTSRPATIDEARRIWPALRAAHLMSDADELLRHRDRHPEWVRLTSDGGAILMDRWRADLDLLAILGVWAPRDRTASIVSEMIVLAREWGYSAVLSPLVPESGTAPYLEAGMSEHTRLVALTRAIGEESSVRASTPGLVRLATPEDRDALIALDARCFEPFWRYGPRELAAAFAADRVTVCEDGAGDVAGYVVITLRGVSATVSRIAVAPGARRAGLASAMMSDALRWATGVRAMGVSLCTQADNVGSRALYRATGFAEVAEGYSLLVSGAQPR